MGQIWAKIGQKNCAKNWAKIGQKIVLKIEQKIST